jgi:hypothetical protein
MSLSVSFRRGRGGSKVCRLGERTAGEVLERCRWRGLRRGVDGVLAFWSLDGGKRENAGDFVGWGDDARRGRVNFDLFSASCRSCSLLLVSCLDCDWEIPTCSAMASLTVFNLSSVACRRASSDDAVEGCVFRTLPNMILYRSISTLGISTFSNGPPSSLISGVVAAGLDSTP